jgi:hypothetical protein
VVSRGLEALRWNKVNIGSALHVFVTPSFGEGEGPELDPETRLLPGGYARVAFRLLYWVCLAVVELP